MKRYTICFQWISIILVYALPYNSFSQNWTWVRGSNAANQFGVFGIQGTAASSNNPGSRYYSASWTDNSGNFWLYGGYGFPASGSFGKLNDLWKYNPITNEWTWINGSNGLDQVGIYGTQGTAAAANIPGARNGSVSWTDAVGNLWLFGGFGYSASSVNPSRLNDLWKYDIANNEWTWINGSNTTNQTGSYGTMGIADSSNMPGARENSVSWVDTAGNLWLFGGWGYAASGIGNLNDLWKYDITNNKWTWVKGSNTTNQNGSYGSIGTSASTNLPGGRQGALSWTDTAGNFWMFGGTGYPDSGTDGWLNDLWKYNVAANEWTWIKGSSVIDQNGTYGTLGASASSNVPGARTNPVGWVDTTGNLCLFGGHGFATSGNTAVLNDLWRYNINTNEWAWISGSNTAGQTGNYGTIGIPASNNTPGARQAGAAWSNGSGDLWLFGGDGVGSSGPFNDVWKFNTAVVTTSVTEETEILKTQIFPNPNHGEFVLLLSTLTKNANVEIYNSVGELIYSQNISIGNTAINLKDCSNGLYYVRVNNNNTQKVLKIVKE